MSELAYGATATAAIVGVLGVVVLLRHTLRVVTVRGISMEPAYRDGDRVLVRRRSAFTPGQVVVVAAPNGRAWLIKRVAAVPGDPMPRASRGYVPPGHLYLLGDNEAASFDSRQLGCFPVERVLGSALHPIPRAAADG